MQPPRPTPRALVLAALAALVALALFVRLRANDFMLPNQPEPDAVIVWQAAYWDRPEGADANAFAYPAPFYPYLLSKLLAALPGRSYPVLEPASAPLEDHLAAAGRRYVRGRTLIAWLSVIAIPALYALARRFLEPGWSLCAAAFLATSLLFQAYSQQARPHAASTALSLLAVVAALRILRRPTWGSYLLGALASFVTIGALHNGVFVLPCMVLAHAFAPRRNWPAFFASAVVVALVIPVFYPFYVEAGIDGIFRDDGIDLGGQALRGDLLSGAGYLHVLRAFWGWDPTLAALAALGLAIGVARIARPATRPARTTLHTLAVVAAFPISFVLVWGLWNVVPARFVNPLLPYLALLAAYAARETLTRFLPARAPALVAGSLVLLALPAIACARLSTLRARPDTLAEAARWLETHADAADDRVAVEILLYLPLAQSRAGLEAMPPWSLNAWEHYQLDLLRADPAAEEGRWDLRVLFRPEFYADRRVSADEITSLLAADAPDWVVVAVPSPDVAKDLMQTRAAVRAFYGEPARRFEPYDLERHVLPGSGYELGFEGFARVMLSRQWGGPIEIYRRADAPRR